jgi:hypothetical protein
MAFDRTDLITPTNLPQQYISCRVGGVGYSALKVYARSPGLATVDVTALHKLARTFDVLIEDLYEIVEE